MIKPFKTEKNNFTLYGALFGVLFPYVATIIESNASYGSLTWGNMLKVQSENSLIWIIDSAPFWLGLFAGFAGERQDKILNRFGRILDHSFNEIYVFNAETLKFIQVSVGACKNLGYSIDELIRLTPLDIKPLYTKESFDELIKLLMIGQKTMVIFETIHKRKDGTVYPVEIRLQLMKNESPPVFVAIIQDITKRKDNEMRLKKNADELERSNKELEDFASIASHDLQEPLRKIITFVDRLTTHIPETDEQGKDYLNRMQKSAIRMRALVEDLLQYTRVGSMARSFETLDLNKVVEAVLDDLEARINETLGIVNIRRLPTIDGDPIQIHQLFLNLIGNALKYHRDGISPVVNLDSSNMKNGFWEITIEDNGIGIEEEHIDKIFKPFERLHGRTTYEGTGIGLTICKKIVSRHGGNITLKRHSANGITFHIALPKTQNICCDYSGTKKSAISPSS